MSFWESIDILKIQEEKKKYETSLNQTVYTYEHNSMSQKKDSKETTKTTEKNIDIVILTAVEDEYRAVCNVFSPALIEQYENGFKYSIFSYHPDESSMTLAVFRQNEMGMVSASITATIAINKFNPKIILMCGVCAGIKGKANYGDLIVFSPVYNYEFGKYINNRFLPDFKQWHLPGTVRAIIEQMINNKKLLRKIKDSWNHNIGKPETELTVHIYPGGSGSSVITDESVVEEIKSHQRTIGAIDMESFAIAEVANIASKMAIPWLVVKAVQDFATPLKNDQYREYSAHVSGVFAKCFLDRYYSTVLSSTNAMELTLPKL